MPSSEFRCASSLLSTSALNSSAPPVVLSGGYTVYLPPATKSRSAPRTWRRRRRRHRGVTVVVVGRVVAICGPLSSPSSEASHFCWCPPPYSESWRIGTMPRRFISPSSAFRRSASVITSQVSSFDRNPFRANAWRFEEELNLLLQWIRAVCLLLINYVVDRNNEMII